MDPTTSIPPTIRSLLQPDPLKAEITLKTTPLPTRTPSSATEHLIRSPATTSPEPSYTAPPTPFPPGTPVWGRTNVNHAGNARDYTIAHTYELCRRPGSVDEISAASVPLSAETAVQALFTRGGLAGLGEGAAGRERNKGKKVLITAASGGVGVWLLQLAREAGVGGIVATSVGEWAAEAAGRAGEAGKVDLVVDCKGGESLAHCWGAVKDGGVLLSICEPPEGRKPGDCVVKDVRNEFFIMEPKGDDLLEVGRLFDEGKVKTVVDSVWKLEEYKQAFEKLDTGHSRGKILLTL
ncbi:hypothetical protein ACJ72_04167 [Emergomyces africanus]|uniref:Enoyl reductase (ER) domain-containing protein n=1 Tax=Emergomyces africanus TaxID=1955775 RepID=A0A1B7NXK3_9EURO|nr:hypothetical protein ACJ72_04167 [Emergomyces africanus]